MKVQHVLLLAATVCLIGGCAQKVDVEAEKAMVKSVFDQFEQFWETEDMKLLSNIMVHDADMVNSGTDAAEYFVGWEALKSSVEQMLPVLDNIRITVREQVFKVHPSGQVAWFVQVWDWDLEYQGQAIHSEGQRLTGVLEKRSGRWVIVQFHNSVPVSG